jgi:hypothetical protein
MVKARNDMYYVKINAQPNILIIKLGTCMKTWQIHEKLSAKTKFVTERVFHGTCGLNSYSLRCKVLIFSVSNILIIQNSKNISFVLETEGFRELCSKNSAIGYSHWKVISLQNSL